MTSWNELTRVFGRIGLLSFGGPAAQIALMHRELVEKKRWLDEQAYLRALSLCMLLPGPEAMQLATYAGWRLRGVPGGLLAGLLFVLPGALVILALTFIYINFGTLPIVQAAFSGVKATIIVIVLTALLRLSKKALAGPVTWMLALGALAALYLFGLPFPVIVLVAALVGWFALPRDDAAAPDMSSQPREHPWRVAGTLALLWAAPLLVLWVTAQEFLLQLGLFFSRLAVVTFGGAYAVLTYMTQEIVQRFGWITTGQMIDALGLAETTPGPLILVTEFVALLAGFNEGGAGLALAAGLLCLWVTFLPCFLWIFLAGPYVDRLAAWPRLSAALKGITAAVVGVIANLSIWFGTAVLFSAGANGPVISLQTFNPVAAGIVVFSAILMGIARRGFITTLAASALVGAFLGFLGLL